MHGDVRLESASATHRSQLVNLSYMSDLLSRAVRWVLLPAVLVNLIVVAGCGSDAEADADAANKLSRSAATSLQQAMDSTARSIDGVRGTRGSLDRLGSSLQSSIDQTGDVIAVLTAQANSPDTQALLDAARAQRTFLQAAKQSASARSRSTGLGAVARAREAGRKASTDYAAIARKQAALAGVLPASTTFNTGRLRDAVASANKAPSGKSTGGGSAAAAPASAGNCGGGVSVNSVTSCPFGLNVADAYAASGGASVIDVYSPVTGEDYTMRCTSSIPVECRGGNGAVVTIR